MSDEINQIKQLQYKVLALTDSLLKENGLSVSKEFKRDVFNNIIYIENLHTLSIDKSIV